MFRYCAALVLVAMSQSASEGADLQQLRDQMQSPEPAVRSRAIQEVAKLAQEPQGTEYRKLLFSTLADSNENVRLETLSGLENLDDARIPNLILIPRAVPDLRALLTDKKGMIRLKAANVLAMLGPSAEDAVPELLRCAADPDPSVRARSIRALGYIHANPDKVVPVLIRALKDPDTSAAAAKKKLSCSVPIAAADALAKYETAAATAIPALMEATKSSDHYLASFAVGALGYIKSKPDIVLPFLVQLLNDPKCEDLRVNAARSIGRFRGNAKHALPDLLKAMKCEGVKDPDRVQGIRCGVLFAFGLMGTDAKDAIPAVLELFLDKDQDHVVRYNAIQAVAKIAPGSKAAVPPLIEALPKKEFTSYMHQIADALAAIGEPSVESLVKLLANTTGAQSTSKEYGVRLVVIGALGKIGPKAELALPLLHAALQADDTFIRLAAEQAVRRIEK